ncbi:MAG: RsmB/NOP family class I SAM-dependent RNA methyltransferase [Pseudomonadota bacterium]
MTPGARLAAAIPILDAVIAGQAAEPALLRWARSARYAGSKDRAAVRDLVFEALRKRRSAQWCSGQSEETGRSLAVGLTAMTGAEAGSSARALAAFSGEGYAPPPLSETERAALRDLGTAPREVALDIPAGLSAVLDRALGAETDAVMAALRRRAPLDLRVNTLKTDRPAAAATLAAAGIETAAVGDIPSALRITGPKTGIKATQAYADGLVDIQDAASQAVVLRAGAAPGQRVLDFCAGGGGKALALAAAMARQGVVVAHDADPARMADLPKRADRAGVRIAMRATAELSAEPPFDMVFVDAPCSGSGAWRRSPDSKWRLDADGLARYAAQQAAILDAATAHVAPGGRLIYVTCALFREENEDQTAAFLTRHPAARIVDEMRLGAGDPGDGFYFCAIVLV